MAIIDRIRQHQEQRRQRRWHEEAKEDVPFVDEQGEAMGVGTPEGLVADKKYNPKKHADILEREGRVGQSLKMREAYASALKNETEAQWYNALTSMEGIRTGYQLIAAGETDQGMKFANRFLPQGQQLVKVQPMQEKGKYLVRSQDEDEPYMIDIDDINRALTDSKTQFIYDQQLLQISARAKKDGPSMDDIKATAFQKQIMRNLYQKQGLDNETIDRKYPQLIQTKTENELMQKEVVGSALNLVSQAINNNPAMLEMISKGGPDGMKFMANLVEMAMNSVKTQAKVSLEDRPAGQQQEFTPAQIEAFIAGEEARTGRKIARTQKSFDRAIKMMQEQKGR